MGFSSKLNHGEAVLIGINNAIKLSNKYKFLKHKTYNLIRNHLNKIQLNKSFKQLFTKKDISNIISFMKSDKKNNSNYINIILIKSFGKIETNYQMKQRTLKKFLMSELNEKYL